MSKIEYRNHPGLEETDEPIGDILAKFYVSKVELNTHQDAVIYMSAVSRGARNADWASATPGGTITLTVNNPLAVEKFMKALRHKGGPEFEIVMRHVPQPVAGDGHAFAPSPAGHYNTGRCAECGDPEEQH